MEGVDGGHLYRRSRYQRIMAVLRGSRLSESFPQMFKDQHQLKGFYRLMSNKSISQATFLSGYCSGLIQFSIEQAGHRPWLLVQDTMLTDYRHLSLDLGYTQNERTNGFLLHHGLLLDEAFTPLGLLHQQVIHRERDGFGRRGDCEGKPIADKESNKWIEGVKTGAAFSAASERPLIHLMDREADIIEVINACLEQKQYFVIRARHDRSTLSRGQQSRQRQPAELFRLFHLMRSQASCEQTTRRLYDTHGKPYRATCDIGRQAFPFRDINLPVDCVWLKEQQPLPDKEAAEWFLLTNLPRDEYTASQVAELYSQRWTIEDFHKCYKTGCTIERRQLGSRKTLTTAIGLLALPAVMLLRSRYQAQRVSQAPFEQVITDSQAQQLAKGIAPRYLKPADLQEAKPCTVLWWLLLLGRLGGHQGCHQKGMPGWQTLWKGYQYFQTLLEGYKQPHNTC